MEHRAKQCFVAPHIPVLLKEVLAGLSVHAGGRYIDATIGAGGHAEGILQESAPDGRLLGLDADPQALVISEQRLVSFGPRATLVCGNFAQLLAQADAQGFDQADGVLFDLGLSSMELEDPARGFSFQLEGPLDMRFGPDRPQTAGDLLNTLSERELADLIYRHGEEPASRAIAHAIVTARPLHTTVELAQIVAGAMPKGRGGRRESRIHSATRTFQALRIAVNDELNALEKGLAAALLVLKSGGRLAIISFHSLEDRIVKQFFAREARDCLCPPESLVCTCHHRARLDILTRKPIRPGKEETERNPRSRSAKLRIAVKR